MEYLVKKIQERFFSKLEQQTNWGKEQVKNLYKDIVIEVTLDYLESKG